MTQNDHSENLNPEHVENADPNPEETKTEEHPDETEGKDKHHKGKPRKEGKTGKYEEEIEKLNDKYLRLYSEFDNYRKRTIKEKIEFSKTASSEVIAILLPVLDDFERAINALGTSVQENEAVKDGVVLIYNKLLNILTQQGLEQMKTIGHDFDTDFHEAITNIPAPDQKGKVIDEIEKGYLLNGKVIRFAKVVVGS